MKHNSRINVQLEIFAYNSFHSSFQAFYEIRLLLWIVSATTRKYRQI